MGFMNLEVYMNRWMHSDFEPGTREQNSLCQTRRLAIQKGRHTAFRMSTLRLQFQKRDMSGWRKSRDVCIQEIGFSWLGQL